MRVAVFSGNLRKSLGEGLIIGFVTVHTIRKPDGSLVSLKNAEKVPPKRLTRGREFLTWSGVPKIRLDTGRVVYGCQVHWIEVPYKLKRC